MDLLLHSIQLDWPVLVPIFICSILTIAVAINRWAFYAANKRQLTEPANDNIIIRLRIALENNDMNTVRSLAERCGGIIGELIEEAIRIFTSQRKGFSRSFDISATLATRKLEHHLTILGTIGGVAPFLGLFGTVVRILYTFQDLASQGNQSAAVAMGIGSALIATAFGLGVAIVAVICYNSFQASVKRFEDDFQLIKLLFLSFVDSEEETKINSQAGSIAL